MPIKKRGGGTVTLKKAPWDKDNTQQCKKPKNMTNSGKTKQSVEKKPPATPKIRKRQPNRSEYVYSDGGVLVVKTPAECTNWPMDFRLRLTAEYVAPCTMKSAGDFKKRYEENGYQEQEYLVSGRTVRVLQPYDKLTDGKVVVTGTFVLDVKKRKTLFLPHKDAAMRMLATYCFLRDVRIGGVPKLTIADV